MDLNEAAEQFAPNLENIGVLGGFNKLINEAKQFGFKAGAQWQKGQDKELINLARQLINAYDFRHPDTNQLLAGYTNEEALLKFNTLYGDFLNA